MAMLLSACSEPGERQQHWYRGNTHTHTNSSDGDETPENVARWYQRHGYQFLFITDHERLSNTWWLNLRLGLPRDFLLLQGQEITQWSADPRKASAHVNALFVSQVIWPVGKRTCVGGGCGAIIDANVPLASTIIRNVHAIHAQHGIAQINHPNYRWSLEPSDLVDLPYGTLLEIWNAQHSAHNLGGVTAGGDKRLSAEGLWDVLLTQGKRIWGVAADDSHIFHSPQTNTQRGASPGQGWIMVRAKNLSPAAIKSSIAAGNFYASTGVALEDVRPTRSGLSLTVSPSRSAAYVTRFVGDGGRILAKVSGTTASYRFHGTESYVRAVVVDNFGKQAWTQPVFKSGLGQSISPSK